MVPTAGTLVQPLVSLAREDANRGASRLPVLCAHIWPGTRKPVTNQTPRVSTSAGRLAPAHQVSEREGEGPA